MSVNEARYNVVCLSCGHTWQPGVKSPLWWRAHSWAQKGRLDAIHALPQECGCVDVEYVEEPTAPYRVVGYTDLLDRIDIPFFAPMRAAKKYLELAREYGTVMSFQDNTHSGSGLSSLQQRVYQLERGGSLLEAA